MTTTFHPGDKIIVQDTQALNEFGLGKLRLNCVVRLVADTMVLVYVPRYSAEMWFSKAPPFDTPNGRLKLVDFMRDR